MHTIFIFVFSIMLCNNLCFGKILFSNECEIAIVDLIDNSKQTINIAVYSITNDKIVNALYKAKNRGVDIKILTDTFQARQQTSHVTRMYFDGFNIRIHTHDKTMHHKFAIFDSKQAVHGSFNWTYSASHYNSEDCNIFSNVEDIQTLENRFQDLLELNTKEKSDDILSKQ